MVGDLEVSFFSFVAFVAGRDAEEEGVTGSLMGVVGTVLVSVVVVVSLFFIGVVGATLVSVVVVSLFFIGVVGATLVSVVAVSGFFIVVVTTLVSVVVVVSLFFIGVIVTAFVSLATVSLFSTDASFST